jgi:hypothetical protein
MRLCPKEDFSSVFILESDSHSELMAALVNQNAAAQCSLYGTRSSAAVCGNWQVERASRRPEGRVAIDGCQEKQAEQLH